MTSGAHGSTFGGNPLACAAAIATLNTIEKESLLEQADETGEYIMDAIAEIAARHPSIGDIRGRGLMVGIEFVKDKETKERATEMRNALIQRTFEEGLLMIPCGTNSVRMTPPLNIPRNLVNEGLQIFENILTEVEHQYL